jgi:hypothetical protein
MSPRGTGVLTVLAALTLVACADTSEDVTPAAKSGETEASRCDPSRVVNALSITYDEDGPAGSPSPLEAAKPYLPTGVRLQRLDVGTQTLVVAEKDGQTIAEANVVAASGRWFVDHVVTCTGQGTPEGEDPSGAG